MVNSKTGEPSHRLRLPKPWKKNRSESRLDAELEQSENGRLVCLSLAALALFRIVLTLVPQHFPTPSLQSPPAFFKKVTRLFKHPEAVYMAFALQEEVN